MKLENAIILDGHIYVLKPTNQRGHDCKGCQLSEVCDDFEFASEVEHGSICLCRLFGFNPNKHFAEVGETEL